MGPLTAQLILTGVDSSLFLRNVTHTLIISALYERNTNEPGVLGDSEVPHQMA